MDRKKLSGVSVLASFLCGAAIFFFVMGLLALIAIPYTNSRLQDLREHGKEITGTVKERYFRSDRGIQREYVMYQFTSEGKSFTGKEAYTQDLNLQAGMPVSVTYLPGMPEKNLLTTALHIDFTPMLRRMACYNWAGALVLFLLYRKQKSVSARPDADRF